MGWTNKSSEAWMVGRLGGRKGKRRGEAGLDLTQPTERGDMRVRSLKAEIGCQGLKGEGAE